MVVKGVFIRSTPPGDFYVDIGLKQTANGQTDESSMRMLRGFYDNLVTGISFYEDIRGRRLKLLVLANQ
jgi:hypothetical protein